MAYKHRTSVLMWVESFVLSVSFYKFHFFWWNSLNLKIWIKHAKTILYCCIVYISIAFYITAENQKHFFYLKVVAINIDLIDLFVTLRNRKFSAYLQSRLTIFIRKNELSNTFKLCVRIICDLWPESLDKFILWNFLKSEYIWNCSCFN